MSRFQRARAIAAGLAACTLVAGASFFGTDAGLSTVRPNVLLTAANDFSITGTVTAWPGCPVSPAALLYPGTERCLTYTVHNPLHAAISVVSLSTAIDTTVTTAVPADCPLDLSQAALSGSLAVPVLTVPPLSSLTVTAPIMLTDTGTDQQDCKNFTFALKYSGSADYTEVYGTGTVVTSSQNPSVVGQSVTYTATVTATPTGSQDAVPSAPTGTVTFKDGTTAICSNVPLTAQPDLTATAPCATPTYFAAATHPITAIYSNTDGNFSGTTSVVFNQVVNPSPTTTALTSAPIPSTFGQAVTLTGTVTATSGPIPTGTVNFYLGTSPTGTLLGSGTLNGLGKATFLTTALPGGPDPLYAVYAGSTNDTTSTSAGMTQNVNFTAACINTTINGGYTVASGKAICFTNTARVNGGITVQPGGAVSIVGTTINGGITATGATAIRVCGATTANGGITATGSTGFVMIGDGGDDLAPACGGNTINGGVSITNGTGGFEVAGNHVNGTLTFSGNTGARPLAEDVAPEVEGNTITGTLSCATTNSPALVNGGQHNTVTGTKTGQCAAVSF